MPAFSRPTPEQLAVLSGVERASFAIGDFSSRHLTPAAKAYDTVVMGAILWATAGRRLYVHDIENLSRFRKPERVLIVCNHRTFFDFFVISAVVFWKTKLERRILFPVRSSFFYDHPLGPVVNGAMSGMRMFPPVLRGGSAHRRGTFNEYSVQRSIEELAVPGTVMGLHPEGTRNKSKDPYALLRAHAGVGRIALASPQAHVIPAFVLGMGNDLPKELANNWLRADRTRIDVFLGPEVNLGDLRARGHSPRAAEEASERMLEAIRVQADRHRAMFGAAVRATPVTEANATE